MISLKKILKKTLNFELKLRICELFVLNHECCKFRVTKFHIGFKIISNIAIIEIFYHAWIHLNLHPCSTLDINPITFVLCVFRNSLYKYFTA